MNTQQNGNISRQDSSQSDDKSDEQEMKNFKSFGAAMLLPVKDHLQKLEVSDKCKQYLPF